MNRRGFLKRSLTALGLAVAIPLMPSVGRADLVGQPVGLTVDMLLRAKEVLDMCEREFITTQALAIDTKVFDFLEVPYENL